MNLRQQRGRAGVHGAHNLEGLRVPSNAPQADTTFPDRLLRDTAERAAGYA